MEWCFCDGVVLCSTGVVAVLVLCGTEFLWRCGGGVFVVVLCRSGVVFLCCGVSGVFVYFVFVVLF